MFSFLKNLFIVERSIPQDKARLLPLVLCNYISNIERKNKCPSLALLRKIVKELDTSYDYLLMDDFDMDKQLEIRYKELFREIKKLDAKTQEEFFSLAENIIKSFKNIENNTIKK